MGINKECIKSACLLTSLIIAGTLTGCASTAMMDDMQLKVDQAMAQARHATDMANTAENNCKEAKVDAEEEYKAVKAAADRAEKAAVRAEAAADRAEASESKIRGMYERITAK